jgi:hypothetical protein
MTAPQREEGVERMEERAARRRSNEPSLRCFVEGLRCPIVALSAVPRARCSPEQNEQPNAVKVGHANLLSDSDRFDLV